MIDHLAAQFTQKGGQIFLEHAVRHVQYNDIEEGQENIEINSENGQKFTAPYVICTLPLGVLKESRVNFEPSLPFRKLKAIERTGMGLLNKVFTFP